MPDPITITVKPGEAVGEKVAQALGSVVVHTPDSAKAAKEELKQTIASELRRTGVTQDSLAGVIENLVKKHAPPPTKEAEAKLKAESKELAGRLLWLKANQGIDRAIEVLNNSIDNVGGGSAASKFPVGAAVGGAVGVAAAAMVDVGDWTSFSGILKKLGIIAAGVVAGGIINGDFGKLGTSGQTPPSTPSKGTPPGR
jgi:hypothetical protein